jgi:hypothetical protein
MALNFGTILTIKRKRYVRKRSWPSLRILNLRRGTEKNYVQIVRMFGVRVERNISEWETCRIYKRKFLRMENHGGGRILDMG